MAQHDTARHSRLVAWRRPCSSAGKSNASKQGLVNLCCSWCGLLTVSVYNQEGRFCPTKLPWTNLKGWNHMQFAQARTCADVMPSACSSVLVVQEQHFTYP